jgi:hypothetical protein
MYHNVLYVAACWVQWCWLVCKWMPCTALTRLCGRVMRWERGARRWGQNGCLIWLYLATNSGFKAWYLLSVFWQNMDQIHALYLWIDEVVAGLTEIATIGSFSFWMATLAAAKFENCGNCLTCSAAVHGTTGRGVGRRRRGRSAESAPLSTWTNNRSSKLEFTHTTGCLNNPCSTNYYFFPPCLVWVPWNAQNVWVQHNALQQRFWG